MPTDPKVFAKSVIKPTLIKIGAYSPAAEQLLLGTAIQESRLKYRKQLGGGPALSYYQIEPATHDDIWNNFLKYRKSLAKKVENLMSSPKANKLHELQYNDQYATAMARIYYMRVPAALPPLNNIKKMAEYWKKYYNTPLGKGTASEFEHNWYEYTKDLPK